MTLHLNLHAKWFDMIASGEKLEEYREIKPYWTKRLFKHDYDTITFSNGFKSDRRQMVVDWTDTNENYGLIKWGAPADKPVYCLNLGPIISKNFETAA